MDQCHSLQREFCATAEQPILNIACKEDVANLGDSFDAVNLDLYDYDPHTKKSMYDLKNFVQGSAMNLPFGAEKFGSAVLGEFIEHCTFDAALVALKEAHRVLKPSGKLFLTFPLDDRPKEVQHAKELLVEWDNGITSWHQTVWSDAMLDKLFVDSGFTVLSKVASHYGGSAGQGTGIACPGWAICLVKA